MEFIFIEILCLIVLIILLAAISSKVKAPRKELAKKLDDYYETSAKITEIEEQKYNYRPYTPKKEEYLDVRQRPTYRGRGLMSPTVDYMKRSQVNEMNKLIKMRNERIMMDDNRHSHVEKLRYCVKYEFEDNDGKTYTGQVILFTLSDDYEVGKYIIIKYKPSNPNVNYIADRPPIV